MRESVRLAMQITVLITDVFTDVARGHGTVYWSIGVVIRNVISGD